MSIFEFQHELSSMLLFLTLMYSEVHYTIQSNNFDLRSSLNNNKPESILSIRFVLSEQLWIKENSNINSSNEFQRSVDFFPQYYVYW